MKRLNGYRMKLTLLGFVAALVLNGGRANADFVFGTPQNLGPVVNSPSDDYAISFSADGLELYFCSDRPGGSGLVDLWVSTRASTNDLWGPPVNLGPAVNSPNYDAFPSISSDGLTLYFSDEWGGAARPGGAGGYDIWMGGRAGPGAPWDTVMNVGAPIDTPANDITPMISADGLTLIFASDRAGGRGNYDVWMSTRTTLQDEWDEPVNLGSLVNSASGDLEPSLSPDKRVLVFASQRSGGYGFWDLWMTTRKTQSDAWGTPVNLGPQINSEWHEGRPVISADGRMLYFYAYGHPGTLGRYDLLEVPIIPIVDLNGDEIVDAGDMCTMIDHWGENYSLCDIGPMPWGDGIVDVEDLKVLAEHLFEEVNDPTLIAHWALDETDGMFAFDSVGDNDAVVLGGIEWQPTGGQVDGALKLDGVSGYAVAGAVLNPADGPFSILAWVKGGAPEQVILSQTNVANWLCFDPLEGKLMTNLSCPPSRTPPPPLKSEFVITNDEWHRIGLAWDGLKRMLYVDGVIVAEDTQSGLASSNSGLYIGCGKGMEPGSFFSGLIDDVRIYNRAVLP